MGLKMARLTRMFRPSKTSTAFREMSGENLKPGILYVSVILIVESAILAGLGLIMAGYQPIPGPYHFLPEEYRYMYTLALAGLIPFTTAVGVLLMLLASAVIHMPVRVLGGKSGFRQTFKAVAYGSTPTMVTLIVPPIMILTIPWSLLIITVGLRELHGISRRRAAISILTPIIIGIAASLAGLIL